MTKLLTTISAVALLALGALPLIALSTAHAGAAAF